MPPRHPGHLESHTAPALPVSPVPAPCRCSQLFDPSQPQDPDPSAAPQPPRSWLPAARRAGRPALPAAATRPHGAPARAPQSPSRPPSPARCDRPAHLPRPRPRPRGLSARSAGSRPRLRERPPGAGVGCSRAGRGGARLLPAPSHLGPQEGADAGQVGPPATEQSRAPLGNLTDPPRSGSGTRAAPC